jgi:peptide/nickel transport system permease protein
MPRARLSGLFPFLKRYPLVAIAGAILGAIVLAAVLAPLMGTRDPTSMSPLQRLRPASDVYWLGTDHLGRDVWSRLVYGARVSVVVGLAVAGLWIFIGLVIGLVAGYIRWLDAVVMRVMDGLMAIPGILLAIALVSVSGASLMTVIIAIMVPEIPRVVRLVRSVVLTVREEPYVEAAVSIGTPMPLILIRHILPNCLPPLIGVATVQVANSIALEATLSFLGLGLPVTEPSLGMLIANGFQYMLSGRYWISIYPGVALIVLIVAINLVGDQVRDQLNPRLRR